MLPLAEGTDCGRLADCSDEHTSTKHRMVIALVNTKSGSAIKDEVSGLVQCLHYVLGSEPGLPRVFDLIADGGAQKALELYRGVKNLVVVACGGDGTVAWVLNDVEKYCCEDGPPVAIIPLGTGNDMSRFLGYGGVYKLSTAKKIVDIVDSGELIQMDRWRLHVKVSEKEEMFVFYNYFSIGVDAEVALEFHKARKADPEKFTGRTFNMVEYSRISMNKLFERKYLIGSIGHQLELWVDGELFDQEKLDQMDGLLFLNIDTYAAGTMPWKGKYFWSTMCGPSGKFRPQRCDDGLLEIIGFRHYELAHMRWGQSGRRLAQGSVIKLVVKSELAFEIDGEPSLMSPGTVYIERKSQALMIRNRMKSPTCFSMMSCCSRGAEE